jgi:hypothetical protein
MFKKREPPAPMPAQFSHLFGKIRHGRIEQVKVLIPRGMLPRHALMLRLLSRHSLLLSPRDLLFS